MATFVLVPGFWLGGWAWRQVANPLRAAGHEVYPITLTGLGERVHLGGPQVNLDTHLADVMNTITFEDLHDVLLVGHSYAGTVVNGVADRMPERIAKRIYVDTAPLPDGFAQVDFGSPEDNKADEAIVNEVGDGWRLPLPPWEKLDHGVNLKGLGENERALMRSRATDMPFGAARQALHLHNPARAQIPNLAIWCTFSSHQVREMIATGNPTFGELAGANWQFVDLPTGHWPMFSRPADLAALLLAAVP